MFYSSQININALTGVLSDDEAKHCVKVLRKNIGDSITITSGVGYIIDNAVITRISNSKVSFAFKEEDIRHKHQQHEVIIAISPVKNRNRFEIFIEKSAELGVSKIIPIITKRTEKSNLKYDRLNTILISAIKQSKQSILPKIENITTIEELLNKYEHTEINKYIAFTPKRKSLSKMLLNNKGDSIIIIGPEGGLDITEFEKAEENGFKAVSLGNTILRTETAGIIAACLLT